MTMKQNNNERQAPPSSRLTAVAMLLAASTLLASCATSGGAAGGDDCNPLVGALVGGAVGALMGGDRHRGRGAAIGAGVGALTCVAYNYSSKQTRTADQVGDDYRRARGDLPPAPVVTGYRTQAARATARAGEDVTVTSNIEVVPGRTEPLKELREEFVILDPKGVERSKLEKTPAPAGSKGGAYVSTLQFTFPQGVPPGAYRVQSKLFVNGKVAQSSAVDIQVARAPSATGVALAALEPARGLR
jgi:predicted small secreted protein